MFHCRDSRPYQEVLSDSQLFGVMDVQSIDSIPVSFVSSAIGSSCLDLACNYWLACDEVASF